MAGAAAASAGLLSATMLPSALLYSRSSLNDAPYAPMWVSISEKLSGLIGAVSNYNLWVDLLAAGLILGFVAVTWRPGGSRFRSAPGWRSPCCCCSMR